MALYHLSLASEDFSKSFLGEKEYLRGKKLFSAKTYKVLHAQTVLALIALLQKVYTIFSAMAHVFMISKAGIHSNPSIIRIIKMTKFLKKNK